MANIEDTPLWVDGHMSVGNFTSGRTEIFNAPAQTVATVAITGLELTGTGDVFVQLTSNSRNPGCWNHHNGYWITTYSDPTENSFNIHSSRGSGTSHTIDWMAYRNP